MSNPGMRPRTLAAGLLLAAVLLGLLGGVTLDRLVLRPDAAVAQPEPPGGARMGADPGAGPPHRRGREHYAEQLALELQLTPEQKARIDTLLAAQQERLRALNEDVRPRFHAVIDETRAGIEQVLTPAQQETFREIRRQQDERRRLREKGDWAGKPGRP